MTRNADGTFKGGDPETKSTARKGGQASGGVRSNKARQKHQAAYQQREAGTPQPSDKNRGGGGGIQFHQGRDRNGRDVPRTEGGNEIDRNVMGEDGRKSRDEE